MSGLGDLDGRTLYNFLQSKGLTKLKRVIVLQPRPLREDTRADKESNIVLQKVEGDGPQEEYV